MNCLYYQVSSWLLAKLALQIFNPEDGGSNSSKTLANSNETWSSQFIRLYTSFEAES
jgi:hypothetical protein